MYSLPPKPWLTCLEGGPLCTHQVLQPVVEPAMPAHFFLPMPFLRKKSTNSSTWRGQEAAVDVRRDKQTVRCIHSSGSHMHTQPAAHIHTQ